MSETERLQKIIQDHAAGKKTGRRLEFDPKTNTIGIKDPMDPDKPSLNVRGENHGFSSH